MSNPAAKFEIKATDRTKKAFSSVTSRLKTLSVDAAKTIASVSAVTATAATGLAISSARNAKEMTAYANSIGMSTEQLSAWGYAADTVSVSQEKLNDVFRDTADKIGDAFLTGGGAALDVLERLNLNAADMVKLAPDQQLLKIAEGLDKVGTQSEKVFLLEALASDASMLLPLLDNNAEKLKELKNEAIASGAALGDMDAAKIKEANDAWDKSLAIIQGVGNKLAVELSPFVAEVAERFKDAAVESGGFVEEVKQGMQAVILAVSEVADVIRGLEVVWLIVKAGFQGFAAGFFTTWNAIHKTLVDVANVIPGIDIKPVEMLSVITQQANEDFKETSRVLSELVQKPMPSDEAKKFIAEVTAAAEEAAVKITAVKEKASYTTNGYDPIPEIQAQAAEKYMALEESLMSEEMRLNESLINRQFIVEDAFQQELISITRRNELLLNLETTHQNQMLALKSKALNESIQRGEQAFSGMVSSAAASNKEMFEVLKIYEVSKLAMKAPAAIGDAFAWGNSWGGPPAGYAAAGITGLAMGAYATDLAGRKYGGASISNVSAGTGGIPSVSPAPVPSTESVQPASSESTGQSEQKVEINFYGDYVGDEATLAEKVAVAMKEVRERDL